MSLPRWAVWPVALTLLAAPSPARAAALVAHPATARDTAGDTADDTARADTVVDAARDGGDVAPDSAAHADRRLTVHGYLTVGVAGLSGDVQFYGVTRRTSADFRYAALQARYALGGSDRLLVQVNHRRLGDSPITDFEDPVNVSWAFYEHTFDDGTTLRAGRAPIPRGIYNELRSVGVALPMYRPPVVFYDEGAYYSETINGLVASRTFAAEQPWNVEAHLYVGGWSSLVYDTWSDHYSVRRDVARDAVGGQLWLQTPVDGVRVGVAAQRYDTPRQLLETSEVKEYHASFDATREHGFVRTEAQLQLYGKDDFYSGYVQLGARLTGALLAVVELQRSWDTHVTYGIGLPSTFPWHRSDGAGLSYSVTPQLLCKAEYHRDRGIQLEQHGNPFDPPRFGYAIASVSLSF